MLKQGLGLMKSFDWQEATAQEKDMGPLSVAKVWKKKNPVVLYIHIPFCNNVCYCCIYNKFSTRGSLVEKYLEALKKEITFYAEKAHLQDSEIISGYMGGGTPAVLTTPQLDDLLTHIFKTFNVRKDSPYFTLTVETTPNEMDEEKARMIRGHGIDRISMGAQSFDDVLLKRIGRTHSADKVKETYNMLREVGFPYICVDLMYGLPGQTMQQWEETLDDYLALGADSLGFYPYLVIPDSKLYLDIKNGIVPPTPNQEELDKMFDLGVKKLLHSGYIAVTPNELGKTTTEAGESKWSDFDVKMYDVGPEGYQGLIVSTFPLTTHIAHSWYEGGDLLGVGSGAYGYIGNYWYLNEPDVKKYIEMIEEGKLSIVAGSHLSPDEKVARFMVMGTKFLKLLRKDFVEKFGVDMRQVYEEEIKKLEGWGLIKMSDESLQVTYPKGWYYIDNVNKTFYTPANYMMPQTTLSNTTVLKYMKKRRHDQTVVS